MTFEHFVEAQNPIISTVLEELRVGRKRTHWMWFVFPQHAGLGQSEMAKRFSLGSMRDAKEYLLDPILGGRLVACTQVVLAHKKKSAREIFGALDAMKFRSSMTLFLMAAPKQLVFRLALETFFDGELDPFTVELLS